MATTQIGAVVALFDSLATGAAGGLWVGEVPEQQTTLPFVALQHEGAEPEWYTERDYLEKDKFRFVVLHKPLSAAEDMATQIKTGFDWTTSLLVANATIIKCERTGYRVAGAEPYRDPGGEVVYRVEVDYELWTRKAY